MGGKERNRGQRDMRGKGVMGGASQLRAVQERQQTARHNVAGPDTMLQGPTAGGDRATERYVIRHADWKDILENGARLREPVGVYWLIQVRDPNVCDAREF